MIRPTKKSKGNKEEKEKTKRLFSYVLVEPDRHARSNRVSSTQISTNSIRCSCASAAIILGNLSKRSESL
jgi:hypothetical protein